MKEVFVCLYEDEMPPFKEFIEQGSPDLGMAGSTRSSCHVQWGRRGQAGRLRERRRPRVAVRRRGHRAQQEARCMERRGEGPI